MHIYTRHASRLRRIHWIKHYKNRIFLDSLRCFDLARFACFRIRAELAKIWPVFACFLALLWVCFDCVFLLVFGVFFCWFFRCLKMLPRIFGFLLFGSIFGPKPFPALHFNISAVGFLYFSWSEFFYHTVTPRQSVTPIHFNKTTF